MFEKRQHIVPQDGETSPHKLPGSEQKSGRTRLKHADLVDVSERCLAVRQLTTTCDTPRHRFASND